jgi:predicted DNA-binding transcriptional regulator YafY
VYLHSYPNKQDLIAYIDEKSGQQISERQLDYDLQEMRNSETLCFDAPIFYSRGNKGYYYEPVGYTIGQFVKLAPEDFEALEMATNVLDAYKNVPLFNRLKEAVDKIQGELSIKKNPKKNDIQKIILMEEDYQTKGTEWITPLVEAIKKKQALQLIYQKFEAQQKQFTVSPLLIKEFQNRWYLIANNHTHNDFITFALDRIAGFEASKETFKIKDNAADLFKNIIGITLPPNVEVETIEISFDKHIANYLHTKLLHHSQQVIKENKNGTTFLFKLIPNSELIKFVLGWGKYCKVLSPNSFKTTIAQELASAANQY